MLTRTLTKLSLPRFAQIAGLNPIHFAGVQFEEIQSQYCDSAWFRYDWQASDRVGWEEVAQAIRQAEDLLEVRLGFRLVPSWEADERHHTQRPYQPELVNLNGRNMRRLANSLRANFGHVISGGIRATTLLEAEAAVAYASTQDPALWLDTATVTVADPGLADLCEVHVYHPGHAGDPLYEIRPVNVSSDGATITITFPRELGVTEAAIDEIVEVRAVDGTVSGNFVSTVDVYRVYNDPSTQVSFLWEPEACDSPGVYATQTGALLPRDFRRGEFTYEPATWNASTQLFTRTSYTKYRQPDQLRLWYYGGLQSTGACPRLQMSPEWEIVVTHFAISMLDREFCGCFGGPGGDGMAGIQQWREDLALLKGDQRNTYQALSSEDRLNPFGTRRGAVEAWRRVTASDSGAVNQGVVSYR